MFFTICKYFFIWPLKRLCHFWEKEKLVCIYMCITLNLHIYMKEISVFTLLNHPLQERKKSSHLLRCIYVSFRSHSFHYSFLTFIYKICSRIHTHTHCVEQRNLNCIARWVFININSIDQCTHGHLPRPWWEEHLHPSIWFSHVSS